MKKFLFNSITSILLLTLLISFSFSQSDGGLFQYFSFEYLSSGARALSLGNTSIANGTNIISSIFNPATLYNVGRNSLELELDYYSLQKEIYGNNYTFSSTLPSFYAANFNLGPFSIGLFQHNFYKSIETFNASKTTGSQLNLPTLTIDRDVRMSARGMNIALLLTENFVFGFGFLRSKLSFKGYGNRTNFSSDDYSFSNSLSDVEKSDTAWHIGILINPKSPFSIGAAYHFGYEFDFKEIRNLYKDSSIISTQELNYIFSFPSELDFGFLYKPNPRLQIALDINNRHYSNMIKNGITIVELKAQPSNFELNDIREYHFGVEYMLVFKKANILFLRGGTQLVPAHWLNFTGTTGDIIYDEILKILYPKGKDELGITFGAGANFKSKFFIDAGFLFSNLKKDISIMIGILF